MLQDGRKTLTRTQSVRETGHQLADRSETGHGSCLLRLLADNLQMDRLLGQLNLTLAELIENELLGQHSGRENCVHVEPKDQNL